MAKLGLLILFGLTAFRYWICFQAPIFPFEAYLHMCSRRLDTAFLDGPAGLATLVYWGNKFFSHDLIALRWFAPLFSILATVGCYFLGKNLYGVSAGLAAALFINTLPIFQISSLQPESMLPALAFWLLAILFIWNALKTTNRRWWIAASFSLALGLQFSYWLLLTPICCIFSILGKRSYYSPSSLTGCGTLCIFCLIALAGPIEWNIRQSWLPFTGWTWQTLFHLENGYEFFSHLINQISWPGACWGAVALALCLYYSCFRLKPRFLISFILPPLITTLCTLTPSGTGPILLSIAPISVWLGGWWQKTAAPLLSWASAIACGLTAFSSMLALIAWPSSSDQGLQKAAVIIEKIAFIHNGIFRSPLGDLFFIGETPSIVSELGYTFHRIHGFKKETEIFLRESPDLSHQFRLWPSYCDLIELPPRSDLFFTEQKGINRYLGRSALYITPEEGILPQTISAAFQKIIPLQTLQIYKSGQPLRRLHLYLCRNYQTLPL